MPGIKSLIATASTLLASGLLLLPTYHTATRFLIAVEHAHRNAGGTLITIDGSRPGPVFDGIGAISGGGGNSRFLIDYPLKQRAQILHFLFGPGGADLAILKLEIGGDANSSDGSEPSIEHRRGPIDCKSGYEWWLAEQAVARDPDIKLYGLQWAAPGWVGSVWSHADANYVIQWLNCASSHGLTISYLGGWNEHGYNVGWYEYLRSLLDDSGYSSVKIVAADARGMGGARSTWQVAQAAATDPAFKAAISVIGAHNTCGFPTNGFNCVSTAPARGLGLPLWESELGKLDANNGAAPMARAINNGFIQAGVTGYLEWPLVDSMPPGLPYENRGLITADQPQSGHYNVNRITWAIAQTTQFVKPGWRYVDGATAELGNSGSYDAYESPNGQDWSLVVENTGHYAGQQTDPQRIRVRLTGGLATGTVHVWATDLMSADPLKWFVRQPDIHKDGGSAFSYSIPPGYVVSFSSTSDQSHYEAATPPRARPMTLPYRAFADGSNEPWGLSSQEGAFIYQPCLGGVAGHCIEQMASQIPVWWQLPSGVPPAPYAIVGDDNWTDYTTSTRVHFTTSGGSVSLIGRFGTQAGDKRRFTGYEFNLDAAGNWQITRNSNVADPVVLAHGKVAAFKRGIWHAIAFRLVGSFLAGSIDGTRVGAAFSSKWKSGLAGIGSSWNLTQFDGLNVSPTGSDGSRRAALALRDRSLGP